LVGIPKLEYISGIVKAILNYDVEESINICNRVILEGKDLTNFLWEIIKYVKDLMVLKVAKTSSNIYSDEDKKLMQELVDNTNKDTLLKIIYTLSDLETEIKWSSQKNIIFQVGIMRLCSKENMTLQERVENLEKSIASGKISVSREVATSERKQP